MSILRQSRNAIEDVYGPRQPYKHEWPVRVDEMLIDEPQKWVQSACVLCSNGCGLDIGVRDGKVVGVRGRAVDRVNKGRLGPKGLLGWQSINSKDRLTHPLIRKNGKLERASWDEAMELVTQKAKDTCQRLTAHGIGFYTSGQLFLEEYYALALIGKAGLKTLHMDGNTRLCTATAAASMRESFGSDGQPGSYRDVDYTECIFLVGHNMAATQTVLWARILDRLDGSDPPKLIVVDPRRSETAKKATIHLAPRIGTNMAVLNGLQHLLFKEGWVDETYVNSHVYGASILREKVEKYTPELVESITQVPALQLRQAAEIIGTTTSLLSTCLQGVYQSNQATASACQVNNINLLRGLIGRPGSGVFQMNGQPTAQNNREAGCNGEFPAFRNFSNPVHMEDLAKIWNIEYAQVPHWSEPTHIGKMLDFIEQGTLQMFWISGTNPMVSLPNLPRARRLLKKPELFVVCQDIFMTETAKIADVILPAAQWGEKTGCFTNVDRTVHLSNKAVEPPGESKSDLEIFLDFSRRMDFRDRDEKPLMPWSTPQEVFNAWKTLSKGRPCDYSGLSYQKLTGGSGIQWPCNDQYPNGKERLFEDGIFFTDVDYCESFGHDLETGVPYTKQQYQSWNIGKRAILKVADYLPSQEQCDEDFPLQLSTGRNVYHFHTRTKTGRSKELQAACPEPWIQMSEHDAHVHDIEEGEEVIVRSRRGAVQVRALIGDCIRGQTFMPFHFGYWDAKNERARAANELTTERWDPISKQPQFKSGAVRIEKTSKRNHIFATVKTDNMTHSKDEGIESKHEQKRERHIEIWLGVTQEALERLLVAYDGTFAPLDQDHDIMQGLVLLQGLARDALAALAPFESKYKGDEKYKKGLAHRLQESLFPSDRAGQLSSSAYEILNRLVALGGFISMIEGYVAALVPVSQGLWDKEFYEAVQTASTNLARSQAWIRHQINSRAPQTLIVPSLVLHEDIPEHVR